MKTALFFLAALIFATFVQAEDSRVTNFKNRSKKDDWLIEFEVKETDFNNCIATQYDLCFSPGIYTPEITFLNQIIFKGYGATSLQGNTDIAIVLQAYGTYSPEIFIPNIFTKYSFVVVENGTPRIFGGTEVTPLTGTDAQQENVFVTLASSNNGRISNIFWLYLPNLDSPEQGTNNDTDDSESRSSTITAVIALLILAILL